MTKITFVSAVLIAAAVFTTRALAARSSDAAARRATNKTHTIADCVRAPNVGAFASAPYSRTPLHAQHHQLIRTKGRAGRSRQPDHALVSGQKV